MQDTIACKVCGQVYASPAPLSPGTVAICSRCGSSIERRTRDSLHRCAALSLAALIMYFPANLFPILRMNLYGATSDNTVWDGCVRLFRDRDYVVSLIVFLASMMIPFLKLTALLVLTAGAWIKHDRWRNQRTWIYRVIDAVGRWSMLDVFVLAILVSLVKLRGLAHVVPGPGLFAFACVVVLTTLASQSFDPQLIWEDEEDAS